MQESPINEQFEWMESWCDNVDKENLRKYKRVLLIGDSIFRGTQGFLREKLRGKYYLDFISSSYTVDMPFYKNTMSSLENQIDYDLVIVNHALHGKYMSDETYEKNMLEFLPTLKCKRIILAFGTKVYNMNLDGIDEPWEEVVQRRNRSMERIAKTLNLKTIDLYSVSDKMAMEKRYFDGTHYKEGGYIELADFLKECIEEELK